MNVSMNSCEKSYDIIGTRGLATCYGVLFYDKENKYAIVGHVTSNWQDVLMQMLNLIQNNSKTIEYYIFPGYDRTYDLKVKNEIIHFINQINKLNQIKFIYIDYDTATLDEETKSYEFLFDPKEGSFVNQNKKQ